MYTSAVFTALLAAAPSVLGQGSPDVPDVSVTETVCRTRYGYKPLPTGSAGVPTMYTFTATTNTFSLTYTTRETVTSTPDATTFTDIATTTSVITTLTTSIPPATTIAASSGQLPLIIFALPEPTGSSRIKRALEISQLELVKRQTPVGNTGGYIVNPDGTTNNVSRGFPHKVLCTVTVTLNTTEISVITALPTTVVLPQSTAVVQSTSTVFTTTTILEVLPTPSVYAACASNNVVDHITDRDGNRMNFDRVLFRPDAGWPIANEVVSNPGSATGCCIDCQTTANCAGSFWVPSREECHLRLTVAASFNHTLPSGNSTQGGVVAPSGTGIVPSGVVVPSGALSIQTQAPASCAKGSDTVYIGTIRGQAASDFPSRYALSFSNGPCGRFSVSPIRVPAGGERRV